MSNQSNVDNIKKSGGHPAYSHRGMVATSQPEAARAGLSILQRGGNAIDAAIAVAAALTVVEPTGNGIGGDAFAIVWFKGQLYGMNSSGPAPKQLSIGAIKDRGFAEMPRFGWEPVTVPGIPAAWANLSLKFGNLPFSEVLAPAIEIARNGFIVTPTIARSWQRAYREYSQILNGAQYEPWFRTFTHRNAPPQAGDVWRLPDHGETLEIIGRTNARAFYEGELAEKLVAFSRTYDGYLCEEDLAQFSPEWVEPISVNYRGFDVWELPPNGQGVVTLMTLQLLSGFQFRSWPDIASYHSAIEATKLSFADGFRYITQRDKMSTTVEELLDNNYADIRWSLIGDTAILPEPGRPHAGGTVYLAVADSDGNMISFIQSNYEGFGSGLVIPGTGIALQNRGYGFSINPDHANCLEPGKKTYHTIMPGFLTHLGEAIGPFGVMGGFNQPQAHVQVMMNSIDFSLDPQANLDAPRWRWMEGRNVIVENHFPIPLARALQSRGHDVLFSSDTSLFGRGQMIQRDLKSGVLTGGTEPRADGIVAVW